eukprot:TRINITY_DN5535_c0_g1_i2.p1 TRINITY_DN5535_c0_g1~~TRINITY_DN5535_c0_g1_i2.p1  ORF type:complete len:479 (+),score=83.09 TRINITY_DN5535_c0_g1_i2:105-1439(+)
MCIRDSTRIKEISIWNKKKEQLFAQSLYNLSEIRANQREIFLEQESQRIESQTQKEQVDNAATYLKCLQFEKQNLLQEILLNQAYEPENLMKIKFGDDKIEQVQKCNTPEELNQLDETIILELENELLDRKKLKSEMENLETDKAKIYEQYKQKMEFLAQCPQKIKKLEELMIDVMQMFNVNLTQHPESIRMSRKLPAPLYTVYQKFQAFIQTTPEPNIKLSISENPEKMNGKYGTGNLQLVLEVSDEGETKAKLEEAQKLFQGISQFFSQTIYPLKFYIRYLEHYNLLVISLDQKNFLIGTELLPGLIDINESSSDLLIFKTPDNEEERNINSKYQYYQWLQFFGGIITNSCPSLSASSFLNSLRQRVCSKLILRFILDTFTKQHQNSSIQMKIFKKLIVSRFLKGNKDFEGKKKKKLVYKVHMTSWQKVSFDQVKDIVKLPE